MPYFSIIIPTYNRGNLIAKTISSVLAQEDIDFEIIVVDDGSRDNTGEVVREFKDPRIRYFLKANGERGAARNYGASLASGSYLNFFDSDDLMYPNHLREARKLVEERNRPELFHLGYDLMMPDGQITGTINRTDRDTNNVILFDNILSCNGVFVRNDIATEFPFENDRVLASAEDWALWIKLMARFPIQLSPSVTTAVVSHDQRSIFTIGIEKVVARDLFLIASFASDPEVRRLYGRKFRIFEAQRYTFLMLGYSQIKKAKEVFYWARKAVGIYPPIFFTRRFLSSVYNVLR